MKKMLQPTLVLSLICLHFSYAADHSNQQWDISALKRWSPLGFMNQHPLEKARRMGLDLEPQEGLAKRSKRSWIKLPCPWKATDPPKKKIAKTDQPSLLDRILTWLPSRPKLPSKPFRKVKKPVVFKKKGLPLRPRLPSKAKMPSKPLQKVKKSLPLRPKA